MNIQNPFVQTLLRIQYGGSTAFSGAWDPSKCRALSDKSEPTCTMWVSQVGSVTGLGPLLYDLRGRALGSKALFWIGCYQESGGNALIGHLNHSYLEGKKGRARLAL